MPGIGDMSKSQVPQARGISLVKRFRCPHLLTVDVVAMSPRPSVILAPFCTNLSAPGSSSSTTSMPS